MRFRRLTRSLVLPPVSFAKELVMKHFIAVPWRRGAVALVALTALIAMAAPSVARAEFYGFTNISSNSGANAPLVAQQLQVEVIDVGGGQVAFKFTNAV